MRWTGSRRIHEAPVHRMRTEDDPQGLETQISTLEAAGARVFRTVTDAVDWIFMNTASVEESAGAPVPLEAVQAPLAAVNVGLESFHDSLRSQSASSVH